MLRKYHNMYMGKTKRSGPKSGRTQSNRSLLGKMSRRVVKGFRRVTGKMMKMVKHNRKLKMWGGEKFNKEIAIQAFINNKKRGKNILLIIDPQNSFSDIHKTEKMKKLSGRPFAGSLQVPGSSIDYKRIISFINKNKNFIDEIHISLDTHTDRHIGHVDFWQSRAIGEDTFDNCTEAEMRDALRTLSVNIDKTSGKKIIIGSSILEKPDREYIPRNYSGGNSTEYATLCEYVESYILSYHGGRNRHSQVPWIWPKHCIEGSEGHKIAKELQKRLDLFAREKHGSVKYHIKGQNNLAEMFSIFSAEFPVSSSVMESLPSYFYKGTGNEQFPAGGASSYEEAISKLNLDTAPNTAFMNSLLGDNNRVFVCGEAKTHCVRSSIIDLMENKPGLDSDRIVLLANMTSPIPNVPGDLQGTNIERDVDDAHYTVFAPTDKNEIPTFNQ